ncbi:MAG: glycoside hydrolase family 15 protein, partial [Acidimicrobiales bacterium]
PGGGHLVVRPAGQFSVERRYLTDTPVLATTFTTSEGRATLYDFFAARPGPAKRRGLWPFRYLIRRLEVEEGHVRFEVSLAPRDSFGGRALRLSPRGHRVVASRGGRALLCASTAPLSVEGGVVKGRLELGSGERYFITLAYTGRDLGVWPPVGDFAERAFHETVAYWRTWTGRSHIGGQTGELVKRSALTLKLLTFAPSGAVVAAPTTSLPEQIGGVRNWDYRYAWIRDASWAVTALFDVGYAEEAKAFLFWATNAARLTQPRVHTMYGLYGNARIPERELTHLSGYRGSRPVRVGNAAVDQLQLDNWGHLVNAAFGYAERGGKLDQAMWSSLRSFIGFAADHWREPDQGIWEVRGPPLHFVHSKVMCWVALDRGVRLARGLRLPGPVERWEQERDELKRTILDEGVDPRRGNFIRAFGDLALDAALLQIPLVGFLPGDDPRVLRTIDCIRADLGDGDLVRRYRGEDGLSGRDGAFVACSFWLAHALVLGGRVAEGTAVFEAACSRANQLGLLPEEIDPDTGGFLGNFPQGLSHIALIHAALAIGGRR